MTICMTKPQWINQIKFLCFDVDGTLYRDVPAVWKVLQEKVIAEIKSKKHWDRDRTEQELAARYERLGSTTKVLDELRIDGKAFFTQAFGEINLAGILKPDVKLRALIDQLRIHFRVGIVSNGSTVGITKKLEAVGLLPNQFDPFIATYDINAPKPDPAGFLMALEQARVSPEESVYIGDKEENDVLGAKAVGMRTVMVWNESREADLSIPTIYDLDKIFLPIRSTHKKAI